MTLIEAICYSNRGKVRPHNEDNFLFCGRYREIDPVSCSVQLCSTMVPKEKLLFGVFDGMGGMDDGEKASLCAAMYFSAEASKHESKNAQWLIKNCRSANACIQQNNQKFNKEAGTTVALVSFIGKNATICNIGDSRVYRLSNRKLEQLSKDHTDQELLKSLGIKERAPSLLQYLGLPDDLSVNPYVSILKLKRNDLFLCCSDGVHSMLSDHKIESILCRDNNIEHKADLLMRHALEAGGKDNITFILCRVKACF